VFLTFGGCFDNVEIKALIYYLFTPPITDFKLPSPQPITAGRRAAAATDRKHRVATADDINSAQGSI